MVRTGFVYACVVLLAQATVLAQDLPDEPVGLHVNEPEAYDGYNLFSPLDSTSTYLMDNEGRVLHVWETPFRTFAAYLLENGDLLRPISKGNAGNGHFHGGGAGHGIEMYSWQGDRLWRWLYSSEKHLIHHDIEPMPNGNILFIAWEAKTCEEAVAAGRNPEYLSDEGLWPMKVVEITPIPPDRAEIVWEWHLWDHLVQDFDDTKANYGDPESHPELMEINPPGLWMERFSEEQLEQLRALGYLGDDEEAGAADEKPRGSESGDWMHTNAINYNAELDQIALSLLGNSEIVIIDHSTTTEEARGHTGGRYGKGGDILYRWGNPKTYRRGSTDDQQLFSQHDVRWVPKGYPGEGNLTIYNNGPGRPDGSYSSVVELVLPHNAKGGYKIEPGKAFGPARPVWEYTAPEKTDFFSAFISGAMRLPNGNTLVCQGADGTFFEVTPDKKIVWKYVNPVVGPEEGSHRTETENPSNFTFRIYRYPKDHPAFNGKDLTPGELLTDYIKTHVPKAPLGPDDADPPPNFE